MNLAITEKLIEDFKEYLISEEKSNATVEKYVRDIRIFSKWTGGGIIDKNMALNYKKYLTERFAVTSVNSIISSLNSFFELNGKNECKIKTIKVQKQIFCETDKELKKTEYERLLKAAKNSGNERIYYIMQTICACGIRVSELKFITVEAICRRWASVCCKGKERNVILPESLCKLLNEYCKKKRIFHGSIFVSKNNKALDRSNIWRDMKKLCEKANVAYAKVFPHNLRHLFARIYYSIQKDIVRLADILGHSSVNTTRIYTMESGETHRRQIQKMGLVHLRI